MNPLAKTLTVFVAVAAITAALTVLLWPGQHYPLALIIGGAIWSAAVAAIVVGGPVLAERARRDIEQKIAVLRLRQARRRLGLRDEPQ